MGVSLWLVPAAAEMAAIQSSLPKRQPVNERDHQLSPDSYPTFLPHITLATVPLSDARVRPELLLAAVPVPHPPIRANFQSLAVGDHYFRSVLIDVQPTRELIDFQRQTMANLRRAGLEPSAPRFPHMSLCYIADQDRGDREKIALELTEKDVISHLVDTQSISLRCGDVWLSGFDGTEVWVVSCEGPVETWEAADDSKVKLT